MFHSNFYVWRKKPFFVKYLNLYKKMLEKDMGSVYKTCFIACGRASPKPNTLKVRAGPFVFNISCAVSHVKYLICCCFVEWNLRQARQGGGSRQAGGRPEDSIKIHPLADHSWLLRHSFLLEELLKHLRAATATPLILPLCFCLLPKENNLDIAF